MIVLRQTTHFFSLQLQEMINTLKNIIRDGGSTALYTTCAVDTVDMVYTFDTVYTVDTIDMVYTVDTLYTVDPAELHGTSIIKSLCRRWMDGTDGSYPLDCRHTTVMNIAVVGNDKFWEL